MSNYKKRITGTFLIHCSPDKAYEWLVANSKSEGSKGSFSRGYEWIRERRVLEYLLLRRKNPIVNLGLAQFACTSYVLKAVFANGGTGIRCAVLANPFLFGYSVLGIEPLIDLREVLIRGNRSELESLALNSHLPGEFYEHLISRVNDFSELDESNYKFMLYHLGDNARLSAPYDKTLLDGYSYYKYHKVFTLAWKLCATVPTTQKWAAVLVHLLHKAQPPSGFNEVGKVIERWRIEDDEDYCVSGFSFFDLRSRLADLFDPDEQLLNSPDLALRQSFYRRFSPLKFTNWSEFFEKDGENFVDTVIRGNLSIWKSPEERAKLWELASHFPETDSMLSMQNFFEGRKESLQEEHPEWFNDDEYSIDPRTVVRKTEALLKSIDQKLETLAVPRERSPKKWWK